MYMCFYSLFKKSIAFHNTILNFCYRLLWIWYECFVLMYDFNYLWLCGGYLLRVKAPQSAIYSAKCHVQVITYEKLIWMFWLIVRSSFDSYNDRIIRYICFGPVLGFCSECTHDILILFMAGLPGVWVTLCDMSCVCVIWFAFIIDYSFDILNYHEFMPSYWNMLFYEIYE